MEMTYRISNPSDYAKYFLEKHFGKLKHDKEVQYLLKSKKDISTELSKLQTSDNIYWFKKEK